MVLIAIVKALFLFFIILLLNTRENGAKSTEIEQPGENEFLRQLKVQGQYLQKHQEMLSAVVTKLETLENLFKQV